MNCEHKPPHKQFKPEELEKFILEILYHNDEKLRPMFEKFKVDGVCAGDFLTIVANVIARLASMYLYHATAGGKNTDDHIRHLMDLLGIISQYNGLEFRCDFEIQADGTTIPKGKLH